MSYLRVTLVTLMAATAPARMLHAQSATAGVASSRIPAERPGTPISLPDVLQVAIRQSPALTRTVIDIEAARADMLAAAGLDDFTLTAVAGFTYARQWLTVDSTASKNQESSLGVGLARGLSSGATIRANVFGRLVGQTAVPDGMPETETFSGVVGDVSASVEQPLLRGFGKRIARADVRRASLARDVATLQQTAEALNVVRDAIVAYWQVAYARRVIEIRTAALKLAIEQLRITNTAVRTGSVSPSEVLAAEQAIALREQAVLQAQVEVSQLSLDLRREVGLEITPSEIDLAPTSPLEVPGQSFDADATIARALKENPYLALLEAKAKHADVDVDVTADAARPRLDLRASASVNSTGSSIVPLTVTGVAENPLFALTLNYEQQLGSRAARGARDRARALRSRVRVDLEQARRDVVVSVVHSLDVLAAARKRIAVSDRAIDLAKRTLEIQQTRFLIGKATNFDVNLRQDELQQASVSRELAVADALAAEATLDALTGDLLPRYHISIAAR